MYEKQIRGADGSAPLHGKPEMKNRFEYRSYDVEGKDGRYKAISLDGEEFSLVSDHLIRLLRAIDSLWYALENHEASVKNTLSPWVFKWLTDPVSCVDLDIAIEGTDDLYHAVTSPCKFLTFPKKSIETFERISENASNVIQLARTAVRSA